MVAIPYREAVTSPYRALVICTMSGRLYSRFARAQLQTDWAGGAVGRGGGGGIARGACHHVMHAAGSPT